MMAHDLDMGIFVHDFEQRAGEVGLERQMRLVNVGLRRVFAVGFRVLKEEAVSVRSEDVVGGDSQVVSLDICGLYLAVSG